MFVNNPILVGTGEVFIFLLASFLLLRNQPSFFIFQVQKYLIFAVSRLAELLNALGNTPSLLEELAETAYIESARFLEMDFIDIGGELKYFYTINTVHAETKSDYYGKHKLAHDLNTVVLH